MLIFIVIPLFNLFNLIQSKVSDPNGYKKLVLAKWQEYTIEYQGGLGILGSGRWPADLVQENVREVKRLTDKPFGANVIAGNPNIDEFMDVMVAEKVPVVSYGKGNPRRL